MELKIFLYRLSLALLLGACIGTERQIKQRSAGLITNSLVALGACIFILISESAGYRGGSDNLRVLGQVVTGIGFLGAGVIMRDGFTIHGLNTAATLWCSAAIGRYPILHSRDLNVSTILDIVREKTIWDWDLVQHLW